MIAAAARRPARALATGLLVPLLIALLSPSGGASAQGLAAPLGFSALPTFAWPRGSEEGWDPRDHWSGAYARISTGFEAVSSRRFGGYSGPTLGVEAGRMWREGDFVYGITGGFDYLAALGGGTPGFGRLAYTRDFAGAVQVKVGTLLTPDVLVYAKAGALAVHETLRVGPARASSIAGPLSPLVAPPFSRDDVAVRPEAGIGVEWAISDRVSIGVEAGVVGRAIR